MKKIKGITIAVLAGVLAVLLTACGSSFDAGKYMQAGLDAAIRGEFTDYVEITGITEEEAEQEYNEILDSFTEQMNELGLSDELNEKYRTFFADLLKKTKYEVKDVRSGEEKGSYDVDIEIQPVTGVFDGLMDELNDVVDEYIEEILGSGEIPTEEELTEWAGEQVYAILSAKLDDVSYGDAETVTVTIAKDDSGEYTVSDDDLGAVALKLIDLGDLKEYAEDALEDAAE